MTKPTQETLREAVAVIVEQSLLRHGVQLSRQEGTLDDADAAIATMFERLRTPSDDMIQAGDTAPKPSEFVWQAMLAAFQQENKHEPF